MAKKFDFVAIGDVVTDAFIRLTMAEEHFNKHAPELCMPFATKIPYEFVVEIPAVGNCANAAVAAARLGLTSALISNQGDDEVGKRQRAVLEQEKVNDEFVLDHAGMKSNYHYVLWYKDDRTILVKHEDYPYTMPGSTDGGPEVEAGWIYLTSLSSKSAEFHDKIADYLESHSEVKLAFQPGTFQIGLGKDRLSRLYKRSEIFFCNIEEAQTILGTKEEDPKKLMQMMMQLGPKIVCITDGPNGAYALDNTGAWFIKPYPDPKPPYDRTGAGDAFASTFTAAIALGKPIAEALAWAPINSMSVVQYVGAREGLLSREKLEQYLKDAPADYVPQSI